tara:strand:+ start:718 stop:1029 length:312 start_codon:yes stop_codon:yes gene_type:complete
MKFEDQKFYNCEITLRNGETYRIAANWMHNQKLDKWKDWLCDAGRTRVFIDKDFNVFCGECRNDKLGNLLGEWKLLEEPTTCRQDRCTGCTDDLIINKRINTK